MLNQKLRNVHEMAFISLIGAQVFSLHFQKRTKDPRARVAQFISCTLPIITYTQIRKLAEALVQQTISPVTKTSVIPEVLLSGIYNYLTRFLLVQHLCWTDEQGNKISLNQKLKSASIHQSNTDAALKACRNDAVLIA